MPKTITQCPKRYDHFYSESWRTYGPNGLSVRYDTSGRRLLGSATVSGTHDPDWKVKIAKRLDATGAYERFAFSDVLPVTMSASLRSSYWNINWKRWDNFLDEVSYHQLPHYTLLGNTVTDSALRDQALKKFKSKLSGKIGNAELLVPALELGELRGTIRETARLTDQVLRNIALSSRSLRGAALVSALQKIWLTYSFGVKPLVSDTMSMLDSVSNFLDRPTQLHRLRASASKEWVTGAKSSTTGYNGWLIATSGTCKHRLTYSFVAGVDFRLVCGNNYGLADHLGFSDFWGQLPSIGWELLPFSWVADYFSTVGDYLGDTFVFPPGSTKYLVETRYYEGRLTSAAAINQDPTVLSPHSVEGFRTVPGYAKLISMTRAPLSALPHRSLRFKTVDEVGRNTVNRLLNLCSLLRLDVSRRVKT